jgi:metal-sulfur cluster biosynthetic enzyme
MTTGESKDPRAARVRECLRQVNDPELGENVVDLGLVYQVSVEGERAEVVMTMTSPTCPLGELLASEARTAIRRGAPELEEVEVRIVLSPAWHAGLMSEAARRRLGWG